LRLKEEAQRQAKLAADADSKRKAAEAEQQRLKEEAQRQPKLAADADSKRRAAEAEQQRLKEEAQRQAKLAADADSKRKAAEAEQQRLKEEVQRQTKLATDTETKRQAAEAEQQRLAALLKAEQERRGTRRFTIRENTEALPTASAEDYARTVTSRAACEEICTRETSCKIFTYHKNSGLCYRYTQANFRSNTTFDTGVLIEQPK
jgi:fused signal recognition particle receptor